MTNHPKRTHSSLTISATFWTVVFTSLPVKSKSTPSDVTDRPLRWRTKCQMRRNERTRTTALTCAFWILRIDLRNQGQTSSRRRKIFINRRTSNRNTDRLVVCICDSDVDVRREIATLEPRSEVFVPKIGTMRQSVPLMESRPTCRECSRICIVHGCVDVSILGVSHDSGTVKRENVLSDGQKIVRQLLEEFIGLLQE